MTILISDQIDFGFIEERCGDCKKIFTAEQIDPRYEGCLATYAENVYCNLGCLYMVKDKANSKQICP